MGVVIKDAKDSNELAVVERYADFLRLQINAARVETLEDDVDAALVLTGLILSNHRRVNDAVVEPATILRVEVLVALSNEPLLYIRKFVLYSCDYSFVIRLKSVKTLVPIQNQKTAGGFFHQENTRHWEAEE